MLKVLFVVLLSLLIPACIPVSADPYSLGKESSVALTMSAGGCSGTVYEKRNVILTATHCFGKGGRLVLVDGSPVVTLKRIDDGQDHTILILQDNVEGKRPAKMSKVPAAIGDPMYLWGNPIGLPNQLRLCYRSGIVGAEIAKMMGVAAQSMTFDCNAWNGDSGSALFDMSGRIVGMVYGAYGSRSNMWQVGSFKMGVSLPFQFTREQLASI